MRIVVAVLLVTGCTAEGLAPDTVLVQITEPPSHFRTAFNWVETNCVSESAVRFDHIDWWKVMAPYWSRNGQLRRGEYQPPTTILLSMEVVDSINGTYTLRHEILHAQLATVKHPPAFATCDSLAEIEGWKR